MSAKIARREDRTANLLPAPRSPGLGASHRRVAGLHADVLVFGDGITAAADALLSRANVNGSGQSDARVSVQRLLALRHVVEPVERIPRAGATHNAQELRRAVQEQNDAGGGAVDEGQNRVWQMFHPLTRKRLEPHVQALAHTPIDLNTLDRDKRIECVFSLVFILKPSEHSVAI
jgi:hypothetical protein